MRLTPDEVTAIKAAAAEAFGAGTVVRLFGSRTRDEARGGDIDLHFEVDPDHGSDLELEIFESALFRRIEPQRVDKVVSIRGTLAGPFERIAYRDGIIL